MTTSPVLEHVAADSSTIESPRRRPDLVRTAVLGAAIVIGFPGAFEVSRLCTTIVLSLLLGH